MKVKKLISIKAESFIEEQFLMEKFPTAVWHPNINGQFHTFYLPEIKEELVLESVAEWDKFCEKANKR